MTLEQTTKSLCLTCKNRCVRDYLLQLNDYCMVIGSINGIVFSVKDCKHYVQE
jgi:hypothetical protein